MRILVACEFSGAVRREFRARGHNAWSCDLLPADDGSLFHRQEDVRSLLDDDWDLMIAHPPCTHLAVSGARWLTDHWVKKGDGRYWHDGSTKRALQAEAIEFVQELFAAPIPRICIENPVSVLSTHIRKPDQTIQPWQFGDPYQKRTCLWLKGLPKLVPTDIVAEREQACWLAPPSEDRWKRRSVTYPGIARAMAQQWGSLSPL